jgi:hypothetical protein
MSKLLRQKIVHLEEKILVVRFRWWLIPLGCIIATIVLFFADDDVRGILALVIAIVFPIGCSVFAFFYRIHLRRIKRRLELELALLEDGAPRKLHANSRPRTLPTLNDKIDRHRIFIVHGHDDAILYQTARVVE